MGKKTLDEHSEVSIEEAFFCLWIQGAQGGRFLGAEQRTVEPLLLYILKSK